MWSARLLGPQGATPEVGAVTWCDGSVSTADSVSGANSRIGSAQGDKVGSGGVTLLPSGNYVVVSVEWANGLATQAGAVFWGSATSLSPGPVSAVNAVIGVTGGDNIGSGGITILSNGNYVIASPIWSLFTGAATWCSGTSTSPVGAVTVSNSLVGGTNADQVSSAGIVALTNGNYVVRSPNADNGLINSAGAATWGNGLTGIVGIVTAANSLMGGNASDQISATDVKSLVNGHYVVCSSSWFSNRGAATFGDGSTGTVGTVSSVNSLVGDSTGDRVGGGGVVDILNGCYVVISQGWDDGAVTNAGAVTWANGAIGISGAVSQANSNYGSYLNDAVGSGGVTVTTDGNYVIVSPFADDGFVDVGVASWQDGTMANAGSIQTQSRINGSSNLDGFNMTVTAMDGGGYAVCMPKWDAPTAIDAGAVLFVPTVTQNNYNITVSVQNSLIGSVPNDQVGSGGVTKLYGGLCLVRSPLWNGASGQVGAITYVDFFPDWFILSPFPPQIPSWVSLPQMRWGVTSKC